MNLWERFVISSNNTPNVVSDNIMEMMSGNQSSPAGFYHQPQFRNMTFLMRIYTNNSEDDFFISRNEENTAIISDKNYLALLLLVIPLLTIVGNGLVVISICREKMLHSTTNYLILSLAVADFLVALCVMPFAVYVEVEHSEWRLPKIVCNLYIAGDVCASTASILNLVAVSWDRYMAVSSPIQYAQNNKKRIRVKATIFAVWFVSALTASPIVMGLNKLEQTIHCEFTDPLYIFVSSLISFYVPCIIILALYSVVLKKLRRRKKRVALRKNGQHRPPTISQMTYNGGLLCTEFDETTLPEGTKTANGWTTSEQLKEAASHLGGEPSSSSVPRPTLTYVAPQLLYQHTVAVLPALYTSHRHFSPQVAAVAAADDDDDEEVDDINQDSLQNKILAELAKSKISLPNGEFIYNNHNNNNVIWLSKKKKSKRKNRGGPRRQGRRDESKTSRKERKATQTLAVVLGVFLICWLPFFICHLTNSICKFRFERDCIPLMAMFTTTWLGYINSFLNPIIYTVFNPTYRKAFKRLFRKKRKRYV